MVFQILIPDWTYFHCPGATLHIHAQPGQSSLDWRLVGWIVGHVRGTDIDRVVHCLIDLKGQSLGGAQHRCTWVAGGPPNEITNPTYKKNGF